MECYPSKPRPLALLGLLVIAAMQAACTYSFSAGDTPRLEPPGRVAEAVGIATYSLTVRDSKFGRNALTEGALEEALVRVLDERGLFSEVRRNDSDAIELHEGDLHVEAEVTIEQTANALPHRIASLLTVGVVPMWGHVRQTVRGSVRTASRLGGPFVVVDEQTLVIWLPLAVVSIPDLYYGALTGNGNSMERLDRNFFRNLLAAAERDGLLPGGAGPASR
jgi:hypothetical protein